MRKKMILRLSVLAVFLALLWSCRSEDFVKTETNPQRNNADFFKHKSSLSAKNTTDYIRILEEYSLETDFLSGMPDQKGMPIWDKMKVVETKEATGLTIPLSYDNETMSSLLFVILDAKNTVNGIRNMTNDNLESLVYNPGYSIRSRESLMNTFIMMDHHTFGNEVFTNIPTDLFAGHKEGENNNRLIYKGDHGDFTHNVEHNAEGKILVIYNTTCTTSWHCKNDKPIGYCDGCSKCKTTACGTTITTIFIDGNSDFPTWDGSGSEGGGDGSSGGTTAPPKDPCGLASVFYRPAPGCGGGGGTGPDLKDPCAKIKSWFKNTKFKTKYDSLTKTTPTNIFDLDHEMAAYMRYSTLGSNVAPAFVNIDMPTCSTDGDLPAFTEGMGGLMHTHNNESCSGGIPIKVPSPTDIRTFVNTLMPEAAQYAGGYHNAYSLVTTSGGNYMLMYSGVDYPGAIKHDEWEKLQVEYKKAFALLYSDKENVTQTDIERIFIKFMGQQVLRPEIEVYNVTPNTAIKLEYNPFAPNVIKKTPCP